MSVPRWPALPDIVAEQLALIEAEQEPDEEEDEPQERTDLNTGEVVDGPVTRPWDLGELVGEFRDAVYGWLDDVVLWFNRCYGWQEHQLIPACWDDHGGLALDLAAVAFGRMDAYATGTPAFVSRWHNEVDDLLRRMATALGENDGRDCRSGKHSTPADYVRQGVQRAIEERSEVS
ncbi:hypothetical protein ACIOJE_34980 [Kitasatospora sp. NPDC087861]|uniref:hypothetical protein n=1 Tax=Kitasatospora sp. NPDC087861 TaxID=3364070 RepID=UPI003827F649